MTRRTPVWIYLATVVPPLLVIAFVALQPWVRPAALLKDPLTAAGAHDHPYLGLISNLGVLLWCATASVCLFVGAVLRRCGGDAGAVRLLHAGAGLTIVLLLDDFFLAHEVVFPTLLGIDETLVYAAYAALGAAYLVRFRREILDGGCGPLLLSLACFATSILLDVVLETGDVKSLTEDGAKLLGIAAWTAFHLRLAWRWITPELLRAPR